MIQHLSGRAARLFCSGTFFFLGIAMMTTVSIAMPQAVSSPTTPQAAGESAQKLERTRIACAGLHGGVFEALQRVASSLPVELAALSDEDLGSTSLDLTRFDIVLFQHFRNETRETLGDALRRARQTHPELIVLGIANAGPFASESLVRLDPELARYYSAPSPANLRGLLCYLLQRYRQLEIEVPPPEASVRTGLYHPDAEAMFPNVSDYLAWERTRGSDLDRPRAAVAVHSIHLEMQQPAVVDALVRALEKQGLLAAAIVDNAEGLAEGTTGYETSLRAWDPAVVVHTCHSRDRLEFRREFQVPHLHSIFFSRDSIAEWEASERGLPSGELGFQILTQEGLGAIEPLIGAGTTFGGGRGEAMQPIPERIEHIARRAAAWARLAKKNDAEKKIAILYYNREMSRADLMRGSTTGMFLNAPRSILVLLKRMRTAGFAVANAPANEEELLARMQRGGRQIGLWDPVELDRVVREGQPALVPVATYLEWFEALPEKAREELVSIWGPPPGDIMVWRDEAGAAYLVIPKLEIGGCLLLPQPLRGEAHDPSKLHDRNIPPTHQYLATYFWLRRTYGADAVVHFGTHGSEFLLPGKQVGLDGDDWPDLLLDDMPNINPWVMNNLGEAFTAKRRAYAVIVDHMTPALGSAGLPDALTNLENDIEKFDALEPGALRERFRASITASFRATELGLDLKLVLAPDAELDDAAIDRLHQHLHSLENETAPKALHLLGRPSSDEEILDTLLTCFGKRGLATFAADQSPEAPVDEHHLGEVRTQVSTMLRAMIQNELTAEEALASTGITMPSADLLQRVSRLHPMIAALRNTDGEIEGILSALRGRFVEPGPGGTPVRNPASIPTGRNMFQLNPDEVPSRASWELGKSMADTMLRDRLAEHGALPKRIAFDLSAHATLIDYGVMEAQVLHLLGTEPIWDEKNLIFDVRVVPLSELGRPRIDVFLVAAGTYRDCLQSRMRLIDTAVRKIAALDEADNAIRARSAEIETQLIEQGIAAERARTLSVARVFGPPAAGYGNATYHYLVGRSGAWENRSDLVRAYLPTVQSVYTQGIEGEDAPQAFEAAIQGTEIVLRNWSEGTTGALSNKYTWLRAGGLAMAVHHLTGREPALILNDVRDPEAAGQLTAEEALRRELQTRLFNERWLEGMQREGYAGADQMAHMVSNLFGWQAVRPGSVSAATWQQVKEIFVEDSLRLGLREFFESQNPHAFQELCETLLEALRKGFFHLDIEAQLEIATAWAESVVRHGAAGGLRTANNHQFEAFVRDLAPAPAEAALALEAASNSSAPASTSASVAPTPAPLPIVEGPKLESTATPAEAPAPPPEPPIAWSWLLAAAAGLICVAFGFWKGR